jgi:hypothetical protein
VSLAPALGERAPGRGAASRPQSGLPSNRDLSGRCRRHRIPPGRSVVGVIREAVGDTERDWARLS